MAKTRVAPDSSVGANIQWLMEQTEALNSQPKLARETRIGQTTIGRIVRGEANPSAEYLRRIADAFQVDVSALYMHPDRFRVAHEAGETRRQRHVPSATLVNTHQQWAQPRGLSLVPRTAESRLLSWEEIRAMSLELPDVFRIRIEDDAMSPDLPRGTIVKLSRTEGEPQPGDGVLIRDGDGNVYFREYRFVRPGHWEAVALRRGFADLDSIAHGLQVLAIMIGMEREGRRSGQGQAA